MADTKQSGSVRCVIVTPEQTSLDTQARSVTLPLFDGLRGVGHGHAPFIGRLGAGEVRIVGEQGGPADAVRRELRDVERFLERTKRDVESARLEQARIDFAFFT